MIRLGVVSDSHDREIWLEAYVDRCKAEKYDAVFHLGDYEADARWLEKRVDCPVIFVAGNCDMFSKVQREALASWEGHRILAVHGHLQDVKYGLTRLSYFAEERGADICLFGHTHEPYAGWMGRTMLMNPGALMNGCYGELLLDGGSVVPMLKSLRGGKR